MGDRELQAEMIPRSQITVAMHPGLLGSLARLARGRALVIGYYASARCGTVVGDLSTSWRTGSPGDQFRRLAPMEGVELFADARLLEVLRAGAPELRAGSALQRGTPSLYLGQPERWLEFLDGPTRPLVSRPTRP